MTSYAPYACFSWERIPQWWGTRHLRFATAQEAWDYLDDLRAKYAEVLDVKIEPFPNPPNFTWRNGETIPLKRPRK